MENLPVPHTPPAHGPRTARERIVSTHVLDTGLGKPAAGVRVELARQREVVASGETDADGRIAELARDLVPGRYELDVLAALAVLHAYRARDRARRRPPPRSAPRLALRVRELPRKLTVDELSDLFEGRTRLVELLAEIDDPLEQANGVIDSLSEEDKVEALAAHPAIGQRTGLSTRSAAEQGEDVDPCRARRSRHTEQPPTRGSSGSASSCS